MTTQAYWDWVADGRPFKLATPIAEYLAAFKAAGWPTGSLGTIGDTAHLQADHPQDHTPFSATGWPLPSEYPYVHAFDAGHLPDSGHDMRPVVAYWLAEARAGRSPWVKYIVWRGQIFDVRNGWDAEPASDHFDHAHVSIRTDWTHTSIGTWKPVEKGSAVTTSTTGTQVWEHTIGSPALGKTMSAADWLKYAYEAQVDVLRVEAGVKALSAAVAALPGQTQASVDPQAIADALAANEAFVNVLASTIAARLGMIPTAGEIAKAVGNLTWHGKAE